MGPDGVRFYVAVPPELEKKAGPSLLEPFGQVLAEGYQPRERTSVPCSATPAEAVAAYLKVMRRKKEEQEQNKKKISFRLGRCDKKASKAEASQTQTALDSDRKSLVKLMSSPFLDASGSQVWMIECGTSGNGQLGPCTFGLALLNPLEAFMEST